MIAFCFVLLTIAIWLTYFQITAHSLQSHRFFEAGQRLFDMGLFQRAWAHIYVAGQITQRKWIIIVELKFVSFVIAVLVRFDAVDVDADGCVVMCQC